MRLTAIIFIFFFIINSLPGNDFPPGSQDRRLLLRPAGDTSLSQLRREAADYMNSNQYDRAIPYLLQAFRLDTLSYEICNMLGECYYENGDLKNSIKYYKRITENIMTDSRQMALAFTRTGDVQKEAGLYMDAIESYRKALERMDIRNNYLLIAGIYDNDLHDTAEAVVYYEKYLDSMKDNINIMLEDHLEKVRLRVDYLKNR